MTTQRIAELEAEVMRLREALVESCMEVESCLDEDPRKTLSNLKDYWFSSGMAEQPDHLGATDCEHIIEAMPTGQIKIKELL